MKILACGDIALCGGVEKMILDGQGIELAQELQRKIERADLFLANIECPLTDSARPQWTYFPTLKGKKAVGSVLKDLGVHVASLANNHIADYGRQGLGDTISGLEEQGIVWVGAGWTPEEASRPVTIERGGLQIGILALAQPEISAAKRGKWGAGVLEYDAALKAMEKLSKKVDVAIAYLHFGVEFFEYPTPNQVRFSRSLIDHGALLVLGHHPHVPQGYEYYKKGFIAYSLGNFIFDMAGGTHRFSRLGLLVEAEIQKDGIKNVEVNPVDTSGGNPRLLRDDEVKEAEDYLRQISSVLSDQNGLRSKYYFICKENFRIHLHSFFFYGIRRMNFRRMRDCLWAQLWPQLFELRIDLLRFLISGEAFNLEKEKRGPDKEGIARLWWEICILIRILGFAWGRLLKV